MKCLIEIKREPKVLTYTNKHESSLKMTDDKGEFKYKL